MINGLRISPAYQCPPHMAAGRRREKEKKEKAPATRAAAKPMAAPGGAQRGEAACGEPPPRAALRNGAAERNGTQRHCGEGGRGRADPPRPELAQGGRRMAGGKWREEGGVCEGELSPVPSLR